MADVDEEFEFLGTGGDECERFIRFIRQRARAKGKLQDDTWIMELVFACLSGNALRWESTLSPDIRSSWSRFQRALLERYPADTTSGIRPRTDSGSGWRSPLAPAAPSPTPSGIPTPAAAPVPTPAAVLPPPKLADLKGRIRLVSDNPFVRKFISRNLSDKYGFVDCDERKDALIVQIKPSNEPREIEILNSPNNHRWLGAKTAKSSESPSKIGPGSSQWAWVCSATQYGSGPIVSSIDGAWGETKFAMWNLGYDGTIQAFWKNEGCNYLTTAVLDGRNGGLALFVDWASYLKKYPMGEDVKVRLVFEPIE